MNRRTIVLVVAVLVAACGGADTKEEPETVIGTPPSPKEDPFFFVAMPAEAVPAAATGTIGDDSESQEVPPGPTEIVEQNEADDPEDTPAPTEASDSVASESETAPEETSSVVESAKPVESPVEPRVERRVEPEVERPVARTERPAPDRSVRCFSCVRICPESVSDRDCGDDYDMICGWGRSRDRSVSAEIATGECNAALDLARSGSRYSSISGSCPAATCR
jgi:hypothetical protein